MAHLPLRARVAPDGVTLTLPLAQLNQIPAARMEWLVPGLLKEKLVQSSRPCPRKSGQAGAGAGIRRGIHRRVGSDEKKMGQGMIPPLIDHIPRSPPGPDAAAGR